MSEEFGPDDRFRITDKGWAMAEDIWYRFVYEHEDIDALAAEYGHSVDEVAILLCMAFQGGVIALGGD